MPDGPQPSSARSLLVGTAFSLVCDIGFAVGLCTHRHHRLGPLIWMAESSYEEVRTIVNVDTLGGWRWPVFFPLGAALPRRTVKRIGRVPIPNELVSFPAMRAGGLGQPWMVYQDGELDGLGVLTDDRSLPIVMLVNDLRLKEMLVPNWRPADRW